METVKNGNMTIEDYMKLSKKRLAELLVERDSQPMTIPPIHVQNYQPPCYAPDGICLNPYHDCINCPKLNGSGGIFQTHSELK